MSFAERFQALAAKLIAEKGAVLLYTHVTPGTYDPATGTATPTRHHEAVFGVIEDYSVSAVAASAGLILSQDKRLTLAASSLNLEPVPGDQVVIAGLTYTVLSPVNSEWAAGARVTYDLQVRQ